MKILLFAISLAIIFSFYSCHDSLEPSGCIGDKIEEFKHFSWAASIVKIDRPGGPLYWFINSTVDGGEEVLNERCELICITDCECTGNFIQCDGTHFDYPQLTIWHR